MKKVCKRASLLDTGERKMLRRQEKISKVRQQERQKEAEKGRETARKMKQQREREIDNWAS